MWVCGFYPLWDRMPLVGVLKISNQSVGESNTTCWGYGGVSDSDTLVPSAQWSCVSTVLLTPGLSIGSVIGNSKHVQGGIQVQLIY